ncbi:hypothetical protein WMY93_031875 [Mugilogobius chulae]|uniref:PB1 domain-containing protein n=1 Tax=Mugilogobius chulae TaxID=88201 RepID=A0AAW0MK06_9GOBI
MELYINLKVNFRGNSKSFLLSGSETRSWESLEAMMKRSFGLCSLQLTYYDEENEEEMINNQVDYEEALKSAAKQGNRLQLNVYEVRGQSTRVSAAKASTTEPKRGFRPPQPCPSLAQVVSRKVQAAVPDQGMMILKEMKGTKEEDKTPPAWFTSYMEKFKDQVVREAVEKICREFSGQCCIHKPVGGATVGGASSAGRGEAVGASEPPLVPEVSSSALPGAPSSSSTPACSACRARPPGEASSAACAQPVLCSTDLLPGPQPVLQTRRQKLPESREAASQSREASAQSRGQRDPQTAEDGEAGHPVELHHQEGCSSPVLLQPRATQHTSPERPKRPCPLSVPAMTATFLDENLPDGTRLRPGTKFIKYWKMRNTGSVAWTQDTKYCQAGNLKFMWGNLAVGSGERWREVSVPFLQPGQSLVYKSDLCVCSAGGIVSVALCAPPVDGSYTSHWRLAHAGEQFGPRVWCSIVGRNPVHKEKLCASAAPPLLSVDQEEYCIPSVDLLTAQDLLSFELLDINIVQELESVPNNTPATGERRPHCTSLPQQNQSELRKSRNQSEAEESLTSEQNRVRLRKSDSEHNQSQTEESLTPENNQSEAEESLTPENNEKSTTNQSEAEESLTSEQQPELPLQDKDSPPLGLIQEEAEVINSIMDMTHTAAAAAAGSGATAPGASASGVPAQEEGQEDLSSSQFVCETLIRSMTLERPQTLSRSHRRGPREGPNTQVKPTRTEPADSRAWSGSNPRAQNRQTRARSGSEPVWQLRPTSVQVITHNVEVVLNTTELYAGAQCTMKSLGPQHSERPRSRSSSTSSEDYIIILPDCFDTSRPLGDSMYSVWMQNNFLQLNSDKTEVIIFGPQKQREVVSNPGSEQDQAQAGGGDAAAEPEQEPSEEPRAAGVTSGLVKGALSVAASAYKALFTGQGPPQPPEDASSLDAMLSVLQEMGFRDRALNQRLLLKHSYNLLDVVNQLVHMTEADY